LSGGRIDCTVDADPLSLSPDLCIRLALIVNEVVTNAVKHAFPEGRDGHITVTFRRAEGVLRLSVTDDGIGIARRSPTAIPRISHDHRRAAGQISRRLVPAKCRVRSAPSSRSAFRCERRCLTAGCRPGARLTSAGRGCLIARSTKLAPAHTASDRAGTARRRTPQREEAR